MIFVSKVSINKGWSSDKKYCVTDNDGKKYLLRVSDISQLETKKSEFEMMKKVAAKGVPMCLPLEFGTNDEGVFSVQSYIDGEDAEKVMDSLSEKTQYSYGLDAGKYLRLIHSIAAPENIEDWESRFNKKIDAKIKKYTECPLKYENAQLFINYINKCLNYLTSWNI